jgi:hypothetical protein
MDYDPGALERRLRRRSRVIRSAVPLGPDAEAGLGPPVCAPWTPLLPPHRHPRPVASPHVPRAPWSRRADHAAARPLASPPYPVVDAAVPRARAVDLYHAPPRPAPAAYKRQHPLPRARVQNAVVRH